MDKEDALVLKWALFLAIVLLITDPLGIVPERPAQDSTPTTQTKGKP